MQGTFSSDFANMPAVSATGSNGAEGVNASSDTGTAIYAVSDRRNGIIGASSNGGIGVAGESVQGNSASPGIGVLARSDNGSAVNASSTNGVGVYASSEGNFGVLGECSGYSFGVVGKAPNAGVAAFNPNNDHAAYLASDCCAAWFTGGVHVAGVLSKSSGGFQIDHPLNPGEYYLSHSFVESPDMKNIYDGIAVLDANGEGTVALPSWFEALNGDFRYQLTPLGAPAPNLYIAEEIAHGRFKIGGGTPGMRVSWQVTGIRRVAWAQAHRIVVEGNKPVEEQGYYLHPELHGATQEKSIDRRRHSQRV